MLVALILIALALILALALVLALILALIMAVLVLVILIHLDECGGMMESGGLEMQSPGNEGEVTPEKLRLKALPTAQALTFQAKLSQCSVLLATEQDINHYQAA